MAKIYNLSRRRHYFTTAGCPVCASGCAGMRLRAVPRVCLFITLPESQPELLPPQLSLQPLPEQPRHLSPRSV